MEDKIICQKCKNAGLKSNVYVSSKTSTLLSTSEYYDENGNFHIYDPNTITTTYHCSKGHHWTIAEANNE